MAAVVNLAGERSGRRLAIRRTSLVGPGREALRTAIAEAKLELIPMKSLERAVGELYPGSRLSMTCSPAKTIEDTLDESAKLVADGHTVWPHISARMVRDHDHLVSIVDRLEEIGLRKIFVVGGDAETPGEYFDAIEFITALVEHDDSRNERVLDHIGYTAYPDSHPFITNEQLHDALHRKQEIILDSGRTAHVCTQMCFSADQIRSWLRSEREAGLTIPVVLGVSGVIDRAKLLTMGVRLGIGTSMRYLSKNKRAIGKMMTQRSYEPDQILRPLADDFEDLGIEGIHFFTFNQIDATESWRQKVLTG